MTTFSYYSSVGKGVFYIDEMQKTLEDNMPILLESWENLTPYTSKGRWRLDLDRNLEQIGTGHYTIMKSLNYARRNKDLVIMNDPDQRFKNIYFNFGLIIDCIKQLSRSLLLFEAKLGIREFRETEKTHEEIISLTSSWVRKNYKSQFDRLESQGISISIPIQPDFEYIALLESDKKKIRTYNKFRDSILPYRNILIHNPSVDIFRRSDLNGCYVVKKEKLKNYRFLNEIEKISPNDLIQPVQLVNQDYRHCIDSINEIWKIFLDHIKKINSHPEFEVKSKRNWA